MDGQWWNAGAQVPTRGNCYFHYLPHDFNEYLGGLTHDDSAVRQRAVRGLAKYSGAQWQGSPDAVSGALPALVKAARLRGASPSDVAFRAEATKALGNIGAES